MGPRIISLIVGAIWSSLTGVALVVAVTGIVNQLRALSFSTTTGEIDSIAETRDRGSDGDTWRVKVSYHFDVNGRRYTSNKIRFSQGSESRSWVADIIRRFPPGTHSTVYYNPARPSEAVLIAGVQSQDLFLLLFAMPFTVIMLGIWVAFVETFRAAKGFRGLRVLEEGTRTRIRSSLWTAFGAAGAVLLLTSFLLASIIGLFCGGFSPSMPVVLVAWSIVLALTLITGIAAARSFRSGKTDIIFNELSQTLDAPKGLSIAYSQVTGIRDVVTSESGKPDTHQIMLDYTAGGEEKSHELENWTDAGSAERFSDWLGEKLRVPVRLTRANTESRTPV